MHKTQKSRRIRTSVPGELEIANRKIGKILYFFNGIQCRLRSPDYDVNNMMIDSERVKLLSAYNIIEEVQRDILKRQTELVTKLKEKRDAAKLSNNN